MTDEKIENLGNIDNLLGFENQEENENKKKKVVLRAPVLTQSGYGVHSRQIARWLFEQLDEKDNFELYFTPLNWGVTPWVLNPDDYDGLVGRMIQHSNDADEYDVSLQLQLPNEWDPFLAEYNVGITAAVEADTCSPEWVQCVNRMDLVIVPSEFVKSVFTNSGECTTKIVVVPEAFTDSCIVGALDVPNVENEEYASNSLVNLSGMETKFNFLIFGQFCGNNPDNDRKNLANTIKWAAEEFKDNPDVGFIVKTNFGRNSKLDRQNTVSTLSSIIMEVKKGPGPKFYLLHGDLTDQEVSGIYRHANVKALVSLTRGEGFGLPLLEAAACGLPVIATNWSAHTEFLNLGKFIKIDYRLSKIHETRVDNKIFFPDMKWANPVETDAKRKMKKFYQSPGVPQQWARELADKLQEKYSFTAVSKMYSKLFDGII